MSNNKGGYFDKDGKFIDSSQNFPITGGTVSIAEVDADKRARTFNTVGWLLESFVIGVILSLLQAFITPLPAGIAYSVSIFCLLKLVFLNADTIFGLILKLISLGLAGLGMYVMFAGSFDDVPFGLVLICIGIYCLFNHPKVD